MPSRRSSLAVAAWFLILWNSEHIVVAKKIAVIGGGISGSFFTKYMVDHDPECKLESITIFESFPLNGTIKKESAADGRYQHSRVASLELDDVLDMIRKGGLELGPPYTTGRDDPDPELSNGMGILTGNSTWALFSAGLSDTVQTLQLGLRYNRDLVTLTKICKQFLVKFAALPAMLSSTSPEYFFDSPAEIWDALGVLYAVHRSFDQFLDALGLSINVGWLRRRLPYQGSLRAELLEAMNLVNYNQDNGNVTAITGLGTFAALAGGSLYSIKGGNYQIFRSAFQQAVDNRDSFCQNKGTVTQLTKRVTTVIGDLEGLALYSGQEALGEFDLVIVAAPMQQAQIEFLIQSQMDKSVVQPMPLGGRIDAHNTKAPDYGHILLPESIPDCAARPYKQVVTTVVRDAVVSSSVFPVGAKSKLPRSIIMTATGKAATYNITSITQISSTRGVYKMFSDNELSKETLKLLFGDSCVTEHVQVWGGPHGGATPDYRGKGGRTKFLLYDGAIGFKGYTSSGALYYPVAMEQSSVASMEMAAVGARAVAKLVAERVGLLERRVEPEVHDEL
jgi:Prenylcysteine lyase